MRKNLVTSAIAGLMDQKNGERYPAIFRYFWPEFITALLLYSLPVIFDEYFICHLKSTATYATLGNSNNLIHFIIKIAEGVSVGTIILVGQYNGMGDYERVGRTLRDAFWVSVMVGFAFAVAIYAFAGSIYSWYGASSEMIELGIPFLRTRALGVFFMFVYFAFVGFLRGIKNTRIPMVTFVLGTIAFVVFDYMLIFGIGIFPAMGLQGSAIAGVIQYAVMLLSAMGYVLYHADYRKYAIDLFSMFNESSQWHRLVLLSIPVIVDKAIMAAAYIWLGRMLTMSMGTAASATFCMIKNMERFAILPGVAFAQIITFLVSNDMGKRDWVGIKSNIKKLLFLGMLMGLTILVAFATNAQFIIKFFDRNGDFVDLAAKVFPLLAVLVFLDLLQLILSGALRGAANVNTVMLTRFVVCAVFFVPMSYLAAYMPIENEVIKFCLIYGSFYLSNGLMGLVYIYRFRSEKWKPQ